MRHLLNQLPFAEKTLALGPSECVRQQGEPGYDAWRRQACWNEREVSRRPDYIVRARSIDDVVAAIQACREQGLVLALRSGGHSFANAFIRQHGVLLDLSALRTLVVDPDCQRATIGPGVTSRDLSCALASHGLGFATGHSGSVGLGGFLLGGGLGINFANWGPMSAFHVRSLEVVTADGVLRHASAEENPDLFWAARGGGPMLFFAAVSFELECHALPAVITVRSLRLPLMKLANVLRWVEVAAPNPRLQVMLAVIPCENNASQKTPSQELALTTVAFAENEKIAHSLHASVIDRLLPWALGPASEEQATDFAALHDHGDATFGVGRYLADNILTDQPERAAEILLAHLPMLPSPATLPLFIWRGSPYLPDAAFSARGHWYFSTYARWRDASEDDVNQQWIRSLYDDLQPVATHSYINEFDLEYRSREVSRCFSNAGWQRLRELKRRHDPAGVFHDFAS
ncbi:FAD-binding oxidoreductase [Lysobacter sp. Hz 25]|uniref:FAD-binding oxidoreductase n=1 Tax=Lysobacter sp. Hz 25 TaxID=3383698 RepID=UPI0038D42DCD